MKSAKRFLTFVATGLLAATAVQAQLAEEFRMWTNTAGKQIEATLVSVDAVAKTLKIKMKDGKEFDVPIATLSPADFEYAKARYAAMQAAPAPATPAVAMPATPAIPGAPAAPATPAVAPAAGAKVVSKPAPPRPAITVIPVAKTKLPQRMITSAASRRSAHGCCKMRPAGRRSKGNWRQTRCWRS